ncbi:tRNA isopentenyltransferase [Abortiporus biennis]|nr:tRNA isopentenyltransferase [Abortiporus biennis]
MSFRPLIAICGTTGVGKSKLAIELALYLQNAASSQHGYHGARIINADAMQVYAGMDVITNKVPLNEQEGVEHLLMGFKKPGEQYVVGQWVNDAIRLIDETHQRNQIPIVVGGTSYWMQHLIFPNRLVQSPKIVEESSSTTSTSAPPISEKLSNSLSLLSPPLLEIFTNLPDDPPSASTDPDAAFTLHSLLSKLDPEVAQRWHWKDTRKVLRSLNIIKESGRLSSEIITYRYKTLCFWLYANRDVLGPRLDERVDEMLERGLLAEVEDLNKIATTPLGTEDQQQQSSSSNDYTLGIYQSIGYREFNEYLRNPSRSSKEYEDAVERMKISTRQYAKRQVSWIRNKLLPLIYASNNESKSKGGTNLVDAYLLDATELSNAWVTGVQQKGIDIMNAFLEQRDLPDPLSVSDTARIMLSVVEKPTDPTMVLNARRKIICPLCTTNKDRPMMIEEGKEWSAHQKTRLHRRMLRRSEKDSSPNSRGGQECSQIQEPQSSDDPRS